MDHLLDQTRRFESGLGGPDNPENTFSYAACRRSDADSAFPYAIVDKLTGMGLVRHYIPTAHGGALHGYDELFQVVRVLARRDLTGAIGHGKTALGAVSVWLTGTKSQCEGLARRILDNEPVSLALTEREHGADISASGAFAAPHAGGYRLNGEKYLINNATRSTAMTVFARTAANRNARDFSVFLVEKEKLAPSSYSYLPKHLTHGIKAADISGIRFLNAELGADALLGEPGQGLDIILRGFQLTRPLTAALSCGAGDHGLRLAYAFAAGRQLYGAPLASRPVIRRLLGRACADLLIGELTGLFASRAINVLPDEMSVVSAVTKTFVPPLLETMLDSMVDVLGARSYIEDDGEFGSFGKLLRDVRLVALFDGSTVVNQQALIVQLPALARRRRQERAKERASRDAASLTALFDLSEPVAALDPRDLRLSSKGEDSITRSLLTVREQIAGMGDLRPGLRAALDGLIGDALTRLDDVDAFFLATPFQANRIEKTFFDMADRYATIFAAACCAGGFIHNRSRLAAPLQDGEWLAECLTHLLRPGQASYARLLEHLGDAVSQGRLISVFPFPLAASHAVEDAA